MSNNSIYNCDEKTIIKQYQSVVAKEHESLFLKISEKTKLVPDIVEEKENSIAMTIVRGESLLSLLEAVWRGERTVTEGKMWLHLLLEWFYEVALLFSEKVGRMPVLEDSHLKNFILNTDTCKITGIDFEHWHWGEEEECLGIFMAYLDSYRGTDSPIARELSRWLYEEIHTKFRLQIEEVKQHSKKQTDLLRERRKTALFRKNTTAAILVGGKARRMGQSKDTLLASKYTFFETILYQLQTFDHIVASISKGQDKQMNVAQIEDIYPEHGPLGALHAVMTYVDTDWVFLVACDMPSIKESGLYQLFSEVTEAYDCFIPVYGGYHHPLAGIYHRRLLPKIEGLLSEGRCRMRDLLDMANTRYLYVKEELGIQLYNINTQKEYDAWKGMECEDGEGRTSKENCDHL